MDNNQKIIKKNFYKSLAIKIAFYIILIEIIVLSVIGFYYVSNFSEEIQTRIEEQIQVPSILMNQGLLTYDAISNKEVMLEIVGEELIDGMVMGNNKVIFHSMNPNYLGKRIDEIGIENYASFKDEEVLIRGKDDKPFIISISPIYAVDGKTPFLYVYIKIGTTQFEKQKQKIIRLFIYGSIFCILITSFAIVTLFHLAVFKRISSLNKATKLIGEGVLDKPPEEDLLNTEDELGYLTENFERMRESLKSQRKKLQNYSNDLEEEVKKRTLELKNKNEELKRFNKMAVGRELKMVELKKKIEELERKLKNK